jgi:hypothetical protein
MANLIGFPPTAPLDTYANTSDQRTSLGHKAYTADGRCFRYCIVGGTSTVAGSLYQSAAPIGNHLAKAAPATAVGATSFTFTPGATIGAASLYAEGYLQVSTTPGIGYTYQVSGHGAIASSTAFTLYLKDAIQVALTTDSKVGLIHNRWKNVIVAPTTLTGALAGVATCVVTNAQYGWLQTGGRCAVLIDSTAPAITATVERSVATAGAVQAFGITTASLVIASIVGKMAQAGVNTECNFVDLELDA